MKKIAIYGALLACLSCWAVSMAGAQDTLEGADWSLQELEAAPLAPDPPADLPIQLILDDDSLEGTFGVSNGQGQAIQSMWLNQFNLGGLGLIELKELWVLFPPGDNMAPGLEVDLVVYHDADDDPVNGALLLGTVPVTIQVVDGTTFSVFETGTLPLPADGYLLVGVVPRFIVSGVTSSTNPAAIDTTASQQQSWLAVWNGDPPSNPELAPDLFFDRIDTLTPGNFAIRAFARQRSVVEVPTLGGMSMVILLGLLTLAALTMLRRRQSGDA